MVNFSITVAFYRNILDGEATGRCPMFATALLIRLARVPRNTFQGSLIPQSPYVVGRVAIQSASSGDEMVRY